MKKILYLIFLISLQFSVYCTEDIVQWIEQAPSIFEHDNDRVYINDNHDDVVRVDDSEDELGSFTTDYVFKTINNIYIRSETKIFFNFTYSEYLLPYQFLVMSFIDPATGNKVLLHSDHTNLLDIETIGDNRYCVFNIPPSLFRDGRNLKLKIYFAGSYSYNDMLKSVVNFNFFMKASDDAVFYKHIRDDKEIADTDYIVKYPATTTSNTPFLFAEGIDAYNMTTPSMYYYMASGLFGKLRDAGRDLYFIDYAYGGQTMATSLNDTDNDEWGFQYDNLGERLTFEDLVYDDDTFLVNSDGGFIKDTEGNAKIVQYAARFVSGEHGNQNIDLCGISMGGVISRYALAAAESEGNSLPVSHFISLDSPQQYATIDPELLDFLFNEYTIEFEESELVKSGCSLRSSAIRELLWNNPASLPIDKSIVNNTLHNEFYNRLNQLGKNNDGYPSHCKNIGVSFSHPQNNLACEYGETWLNIAGGINISGPLDFEYQSDLSVLNLGQEDRIKFAGSTFPTHYVNFSSQTYAHYGFDGIVSWFVDDINLYYYLDCFMDEIYKPTFIPFVSALDIVPVYEENIDEWQENWDHYPNLPYLANCTGMSDIGYFEFKVFNNGSPYYLPKMYTDNVTSANIGDYRPTMKCESKFDEILFLDDPSYANESMRNDHDLFPAILEDRIIDIINDNVTRDITTWNNIWKTKAVLVGDINVNSGNTLYLNSTTGVSGTGTLHIRDGASVVLVDDDVDLRVSANIIFYPGSSLIMKNESDLVTRYYGEITFQEGSYIVMGENSEIITNESSQIIFQEGSYIVMGANSKFIANGNSSIIIDKDSDIDFAANYKFQSFDNGIINWK